MAQKIKQGNIFGRIGSGLGKGLAEQIPKEIERSRLANGLKEIGEQQGQTPFQQFAALSGVPGITPQMIQSGAELLKQQGIRNAYARKDIQGQVQNPQSSPNIQDVKFAERPGQIQTASTRQQTIPSDQPRAEEAVSNPPAANENPLSEKFIPAAPWNQQRQEGAINEAFDRGLATNFNEASAYADKQRELYEQAPDKYRQQLDYKKGVDSQVDELFDKDLQTRLQKEGKDTFQDVPGDLQLNIKKKARNAVATGKMTPSQAAEYYSKKSLDLVKDKGRVLEIANRDILDRLLPHKKEEALKNLMQIAKNYDDMGSAEDYYNLLKTDTVSGDVLGVGGAQTGMGLSPGGAAVIAYPRTEKVKSLIKNTHISDKNATESTRNFAESLSKEMTPKDSFLAIARQMKQQDPNFDEYAFFDYLRENQDEYGVNPRLNREITQGVSDFFPNWRDIGLFPAFTKPVTND